MNGFTHHMGVSEGPECGACGRSEAQCARLAVRCCGDSCTHFPDLDDTAAAPLPAIATVRKPARHDPQTALPASTRLDQAGIPTGALCAESDPELFFPEIGASSRDAKAMCRRCDLRVECLEIALTERIYYGIWGGLSQRERSQLALDRGIPLPANPYRSNRRRPAIIEEIA